MAVDNGGRWKTMVANDDRQWQMRQAATADGGRQWWTMWSSAASGGRWTVADGVGDVAISGT